MSIHWAKIPTDEEIIKDVEKDYKVKLPEIHFYFRIQDYKVSPRLPVPPVLPYIPTHLRTCRPSECARLSL